MNLHTIHETQTSVRPKIARTKSPLGRGLAALSCAVVAVLGAVGCGGPTEIESSSAAVQVRDTRLPVDDARRARASETVPFVQSAPRPAGEVVTRTPVDPTAEEHCTRGADALQSLDNALNSGFSIVRVEVMSTAVERVIRLANLGAYGRDVELRRVRFEVRQIESCSRSLVPSTPTFFVNHVVRIDQQRNDGVWIRGQEDLLDGRADRAPLAPNREMILALTPDGQTRGEWFLRGSWEATGGQVQSAALSHNAGARAATLIATCAARVTALGVIR